MPQISSFPELVALLVAVYEPIDETILSSTKELSFELVARAIKLLLAVHPVVTASAAPKYPHKSSFAWIVVEAACDVNGDAVPNPLSNELYLSNALDVATPLYSETTIDPAPNGKDVLALNATDRFPLAMLYAAYMTPNWLFWNVELAMKMNVSPWVSVGCTTVGSNAVCQFRATSRMSPGTVELIATEIELSPEKLVPMVLL